MSRTCRERSANARERTGEIETNQTPLKNKNPSLRIQEKRGAFSEPEGVWAGVG